MPTSDSVAKFANDMNGFSKNRPTHSKRSPQLARFICDQLALGHSLTYICKKFPNVPDYSNVIRWLQCSEWFRKMYAQAREIGGDTAFDLAWDEAQKATPHNAHAVRIRVDVLKWRAAKLKPRVYGDRPPDVNVGVQANVVVLTEERARELQERLKRLRAKASSLSKEGDRPMLGDQIPRGAARRPRRRGVPNHRRANDKSDHDPKCQSVFHLQAMDWQK